MPRKRLPDRRQARNAGRRGGAMSERTHGPEKPAASTERTRRCRLRRKTGDRWVPGFDVSREVLERLFEEGWTNEKEASDPQKLSDAVADLLDCWAKEDTAG